MTHISCKNLIKQHQKSMLKCKEASKDNTKDGKEDGTHLLMAAHVHSEHTHMV